MKIYYAIIWEGLTFSTRREKPYWKEYIHVYDSKAQRDELFKGIPKENKNLRNFRKGDLKEIGKRRV